MVTIVIEIDSVEFKVFLNNDWVSLYQHRLNPLIIGQLTVNGDVLVNSVEVTAVPEEEDEDFEDDEGMEDEDDQDGENAEKEDVK
ncbi:hypothetical protein CAEBREN_13691 [Caenorhabditis brenneri]|uniref:Galectin n=1 Tax=Caenorhabditis brenneri TaxID=135651 RepID=G0NKS8_CAEBE|nr:hypothetical protein CAEBREN_13691 [Caenorhabditis brenneri]